ncbi:MAG: ABC-2 transporter permease [Oscillospiraceae bacterium]|nr:ABC-2 transporter permease [Oscillospiraceae bacterium]
MRNIVKLLRFDFITASPIGVPVAVTMAIVCTVLGLIFSPSMGAYAMVACVTFIIPLRQFEDKGDTNRICGVLPVKRGLIVRTRALYIYLVLFIPQLYAVLLAFISQRLSLGQALMSYENSVSFAIEEAFSSASITYGSILVLFTVVCIAMSYMDMMLQIFGRENQAKIIIVTAAAATLFMVLRGSLIDNHVIEPADIPDPQSAAEWWIRYALVDALVLVICMVFGEIAARLTAEREI